ncbi:LysR family transcriptional regulator [Anaerorhabdus furcosa]|uniref:DNA-binding transcriptional regulator, LysR family n=1 Tax=Anaerorhabdus furcosa TaxID=118967 RepID=A0A1T4Q3S4_9FIRM|nr:LysR family transcriptional regulator [Anaerorhabdus furcosa]SJZ98161.1 DNA-binding transcriptional regulator, LysR family [Anaerorhabdus furcosa]
MNLNHLKVFMYVCKHNSITQAAKELNMKQPQVSYAIKELEHELNTCLFFRVSRHLEITDNGNRLLSLAMRLFELCSEMDLAMKSKNEETSITVGASITLGKHFLPIYISKFNKIYPNVHVNLITDTNENIVSFILTGKITLAFIDANIDEPKLNVQQYHKDKIVAVCHKDHPLAKKTSVSLKDLYKEELLLRTNGNGDREAINHAFQTLGITYNPVLENDIGVLLLNATANNLGISLLPKNIAFDYANTDETKILEVEELLLDRYFSSIHLKDVKLSDILENFNKVSIDQDNWMYIKKHD